MAATLSSARGSLHDVAQCGYCQTGQIMQAASLLARTPNPTTDIDTAMRQHLPMRYLSAHLRGDQDRGRGALMSIIENVSRRQFLGGVFSTGAFVCLRAFCPSPRGRRPPDQLFAPKPIWPAQSQCLSRHPARWHRVHRHASFRDGHRHSHVAADGGGRRARC